MPPSSGHPQAQPRPGPESDVGARTIPVVGAASHAARPLCFCMCPRAIPSRHARAPMVLGPFAETKGPRRAGPRPRTPLLFPCLSSPTRSGIQSRNESSVFAFAPARSHPARILLKGSPCSGDRLVHCVAVCPPPTRALLLHQAGVRSATARLLFPRFHGTMYLAYRQTYGRGIRQSRYVHLFIQF